MTDVSVIDMLNLQLLEAVQIKTRKRNSSSDNKAQMTTILQKKEVLQSLNDVTVGTEAKKSAYGALKNGFDSEIAKKEASESSEDSSSENCDCDEDELYKYIF